MGIDLTLGLEPFELGGQPLVYTRLPLQWRDYDAWEKLTAVATPVPEGLRWYGDEGIEERTTDPYGNAVTFVTANQFLKQWDSMTDAGMGDWDKACIAFIRALRPDRKVILWWH